MYTETVNMAKASQLEIGLQRIEERIRNDEIFVMMRRNPISAEFVSERVKELFEEVVVEWREEVIERLGAEVVEQRERGAGL